MIRLTRKEVAVFYVVFNRGEPPLLSDSPEEGDSVRSVRVELDPRSEKCLRALSELNSFELASMLAALWAHGFNAGERVGISRGTRAPGR